MPSRFTNALSEIHRRDTKKFLKIRLEIPATVEVACFVIKPGGIKLHHFWCKASSAHFFTNFLIFKFFHTCCKFPKLSTLLDVKPFISIFKSDKAWVSDDYAQILRTHSDRFLKRLIMLSSYDKYNGKPFLDQTW